MTPSHGAPFRGFRDDESLAVVFVGRNDPYRPLAEHIAEIIAATESA